MNGCVDMVLIWVLLIVGMFLLIKGADWFVSGSSKIAKALKIPSLIIGLTLVSMGTSAPEASISITAAINDLNEMSVSNVVGSNIFNTFLILGVSSIIMPLVIDNDMKKYDMPLMIGFYLVLILFSFVITPYKLGLIESITLLILFILYMVFLVIRAKKNGKSIEENTDEKVDKYYICKGVIYSLLGLAMIIFGGNLVVDNATKIAQNLGMSETLVGLTIVAFGTSLPELVTSAVASIKKENDIAIGNVIGSNVLNVIFILGMSSTISSLSLASSVMLDMLVMLLGGLIIFGISLFSKKLKRWQGIILFLLYVAYIVYIIIRN